MAMQPAYERTVPVEEYLSTEYEHVWVIDPYARVGYRATANGLELVRDGIFSIPDSPIRLELAAVFAELDEV